MAAASTSFVSRRESRGHMMAFHGTYQFFLLILTYFAPFSRILKSLLHLYELRTKFQGKDKLTKC